MNNNLLKLTKSIETYSLKALNFGIIKFHDFHEILYPQKVSKPKNCELNTYWV